MRFAHGFLTHLFRSATLCRAAISFALVAAALVSATRAQEYLTLPVDEKGAKGFWGMAQQCAKDPATYQANKDKFAEYFNKYHFPAMTRTEPDKLGQIGKLREDLFKYILWKSTDPALQHDLTQLAFAYMGKIVSAENPSCHPAARYNAILVIGMLDDQYSPDGRQPPKPFAPATKALTGVVDQATKGNRFPPPVILGALVGLERHAQLHESLSPEAQAAMQAALLKLVMEPKPIQEMDRDTYAWMRLRAASALVKLGTLGDKNAVHNAIMQLATTNKSIDDRCEAAALVEKLTYKDVKLDDAGTAAPLFALARDVGAAEDQRAQDFQEHGASGMSAAMPGRGPESFGPGSSSSSDPNAFQRRITLSRLSDLQTALKQVKASLPAESQKKVDAVLAAIKPVVTGAASKDTVDLRLAESIHTMAEAINKAVPGPVKPDTDKS
ncbi:MAG TPA: hypothetical protein VH107_13045, partial [Lacipirellulaceae bacterium]|nr:hypothetical protein [Lacipirellulaceae bacterium]